MIPNDPVILLSFINTQLRDYYKNLEDLCQSLNINQENLINQLSTIDYHYNQTTNQFQ